jgi:hypothetical protein
LPWSKELQRTRHIMRRNHCVREGIESELNALIWITIIAQIYNMGTRILDRILDSFKEFVLVKVP